MTVTVWVPERVVVAVKFAHFWGRVRSQSRVRFTSAWGNAATW